MALSMALFSPEKFGEALAKCNWDLLREIEVLSSIALDESESAKARIAAIREIRKIGMEVMGLSGVLRSQRIIGNVSDGVQAEVSARVLDREAADIRALAEKAGEMSEALSTMDQMIGENEPDEDHQGNFTKLPEPQKEEPE